jgi:hypothetical protein
VTLTPHPLLVPLLSLRAFVGYERVKSTEFEYFIKERKQNIVTNQTSL